MDPLTQKVLSGDLDAEIAVPTLACRGGAEDAAALLAGCIDGRLNPDTVMPVVGAIGDATVGARLWAAVCSGDLPLEVAAVTLGQPKHR